jgi:hypothetical protein
MITLEEVNEYGRAIAKLLDDYIIKEKPLRSKPNYLTLRQPLWDKYREEDSKLHDDILAKFKGVS